MSLSIAVGDRRIGADHEPFIIAELSGNHNGSIERALKLIDAAAATGADAIKIQTYTPDTLTIDCDRPDFMIKGGLWDGSSLYELYRQAHTPYEWHKRLFEAARKRNILIFSTPFDDTAVDLLEGLNAPLYKVASFEIVDLPLIARIARTGKPMIISTGLANLGEIQAAVDTARSNGAKDIALLHCISAYPAPVEEANVRTVPHLGAAFDAVCGLSDHTKGSAAAVAAIALGGSIIEKHITLARADGGPDAEFSMEPHEFTQLVADCKSAWKALGKVGYDLKGSERGNLKFRRSIYAVSDIAAGAELNHANIRIIRPGFGLKPKYFDTLCGRRAVRAIKRGEPLSWDMVQPAA